MGLLKYILRRLFTIFVSIIVVIIITYVLMWLAPGDFFNIAQFQASAGKVATLTPEQLQVLIKGFEEKYGLNVPLWKQIWNYLKDAFRFKFGPSFSNPNEPIEVQIARRFPVTATLAILAMALAVVVGIPLGVIAALKRNTWVDYVTMFISMIGSIIPAYLIGVIMVIIFSVYLRWLPTSGWETPKQMIMPVITVAVGPMAIIARFTRSSLLDVLGQDYIRTAYAKGGTDRAVIMRHALRNSLLPVVTVIGPQLAFLFTGTVWIENLFRVPGLGQLFVNAASMRDYPLLVTSTFILSLSVMLMNLLVDIIYAFLDPRIKYQ
ncbi:MAG: ABC transporter permease [Dictyoglomus thermophilum]|uniref:ABC transporter permease n=1 Tax=Dictyoglomus thermophilum TaxID=14 RepID=A0A7C2GGF2_DICTH|nr:ABC transporter permease [Dictyoglomus thermophilum]MCX7720242.1 ABC transporter permease [Dictyoglomus thermophilum]TYT23295.1 ABC transporter permease [Dictyoglomus thermophilum]